jgi:hypothetical protein
MAEGGSHGARRHRKKVRSPKALIDSRAAWQRLGWVRGVTASNALG